MHSTVLFRKRPVVWAHAPQALHYLYDRPQEWRCPHGTLAGPQCPPPLHPRPCLRPTPTACDAVIPHPLLPREALFDTQQHQQQQQQQQQQDNNKEPKKQCKGWPLLPLPFHPRPSLHPTTNACHEGDGRCITAARPSAAVPTFNKQAHQFVFAQKQ
eukprot:54306-Pelagomonas_calceolata.AAC.10